MPLDKDGNGPSGNRRAEKITYEVWCAESLESVASHDYLSLAISDAIKRSFPEIIEG